MIGTSSRLAENRVTLGLLIGITLCFAGVNLVLRYIGDQVPALVISLWRLLPLIAAAGIHIRIAERTTAREAGQRRPVARSAIGMLVLSGFVAHVIGNTLFQTALLSGVGLAVPAAQGGSLVTGLVAGALAFGERVTARRIAGILAVIAGIGLLSGQYTPETGASGIATAVRGFIAGSCWVFSNIALRYAYDFGVKPHWGLMIHAVGALVALAIAVPVVNGWQSIWISGVMFAAVMLVGVLNALARVFSALALERVDVVIVAMFEAANTAIAITAAIWLFSEPFTFGIASGFLLVLGGLIFAHSKGASRIPSAAPGRSA